MNCHRVRSLVSAYVDGELPGVEMLAIRHHLAECTECTKEYESILNLKRLFGRLQPKRPRTDLAAKICQSLDQLAQPSHDRWITVLTRYLQPLPSRIRIAAAGLAVLSALLVIRVGGSTQSNILQPGNVISTVASARAESPMNVFLPQIALANDKIELRAVRGDPWLSPVPTPYAAQSGRFEVRTIGFSQ